MANHARPPQRKSLKQEAHSRLPEQGVQDAQPLQRAPIDRKRILKSIMNDDASAVARWIDNSGNREVALLPDDPLNNSLMHMVAYKGKLSTLRMMWARGMKCNHRNSQGETALHWAVKCDDEAAMCAVILELITIGEADVDAITTFGDTPLFYAVADGNLAAIMELCKHGASLSVANRDGDAPIHLAISSGNTGAVAYILERQPGAAQSRDGQGRLPIQSALEFGNEEIIKMVLLAWPLCLGCRTAEGVLLHDVFPQLGLLHLVEGLGFGDGCFWDIEVRDSKEVHRYSVDVTISGTAFFIEGHQTGGSGSFEIQLNDFRWDFDDQSLSAIFSDNKSDLVMKLTANSLATHKKLLRQLDLALLSTSSYGSSSEGHSSQRFKVLSLKKSAVPDPYDHSDSGKSSASGHIVRTTMAKDLAWLEKLDDRDIDLMIKWGVVSPEKAKSVLGDRRFKLRDGDVLLNKVSHQISASKPDSPEGRSKAPAAPPRRQAKGVAAVAAVAVVAAAPVPAAPPPRRAKTAAVISASIPSAPPPRGARNKGGASFTEAHGSDPATETAEPPASVAPSLIVPAAYFQDVDDDAPPPPPPPPPLINNAKKCADVEEAAIQLLQIALETGRMNSGVSLNLPFCNFFLRAVCS
jgi:ankyrin repeat protein